MDIFKQFEKYCDNYPQNFSKELTIREIARRAFFFRPHVFQPCGHPLSAIVGVGDLGMPLGDHTGYCGQCADDILRANIAAGVEL